MTQHCNHTPTQPTSALSHEWAVTSLKAVTEFANGKPHEDDIDPEGRYALITLDSIDIKGQLKCTHRMTDVWDDSLRAGDIVSVLSDLAHGLLLGMSAVIPADNTYVLNQRMGRLRLKVPGNADFVRLQINARQEHFRKRGQGTSQRHIYKRDFEALEIPFPVQYEQDAIATALSDVDGLIAGLERLIAKKRDIKQAAMQQLLTGQTRLPGFSGAWAPRMLGALGATYGGLVGKSKANFGHGCAKYVPFVNVMANIRIDCGALEPVDVASTENQNRVLSGDLLFNGSSETPEEIALCALMTESVEDLYLNSFCFGFRLKKGAEASGLFLTYLMRSQMGRELMKSLAQGSTRYNLSKSALLQATLVLPGLEEQTAIATVLSDMGADLSALESRLTKTRAIKQGMMQELLTGRTRLV